MNNKIPSWNDIDKIGKIKVLKSAFIIFFLLPIIAQSIKDYHLNISIPFSWLILYYSTLFISLGTIIYSVFCPQLIKRFESFEDYEKSGRGGRFLEKQIEIFYTKKINNRNLLIEHLYSEYFFAHRLKKESLDLILANSEILVESKVTFWLVHDTLNYSRFYWRVLCCVFYFIGFLLLTIFLIHKIYIVTFYMFSNI